MNFNQEVNEINSITKEISISIPVEEYTARYNKEINSLVQKVEIKGFRKGKAPKDMVEKIHGDKARIESINGLITDAISALNKEQTKKVIAQPEVSVVSMDVIKPIEFKVRYEYDPEPTIKEYDNIKLKLKKVEPEKDAVDKTIKGIVQSKLQSKEVTDRDTLKADDVIKGKIKVASNNDEYSPYEPINFGLGIGYLPKSLEAKLVGQKKGEEKEYIITKKEEKDLVEDQVKYTIMIEGIFEYEMPEITDDYVKTLDMEGVETVLELRQKVTKMLEDQLEKDLENQKKSKILETLREKNEFLVPQTYLDHEIKSMLFEQKQVPAETKFEEFDVSPYREKFSDYANPRVKNGIIMDSIANQENLVPTKEDIDGHLESIAKNMNVDVNLIKQYYGSNQNLWYQLFSELKRNKVWELLLQRTEVEFE